jgi:hypothetical protein
MAQMMLSGEIVGELEQETINKIRKVRDRVKFILENYPSTRGNDTELQFRYYRIFEPWLGFKIKNFEALLNATSMETIRRRREEFNAKGEYLPTDKTIRRRRRLSEIPQKEI